MKFTKDFDLNDLHCKASAARSTERSLGTGSLPRRMSDLTWRKNWYLVISSANLHGSAA